MHRSNLLQLAAGCHLPRNTFKTHLKQQMWPQSTSHQMRNTLLACICLNTCQYTYEQRPYIQRGVCVRAHPDRQTAEHKNTRTQGQTLPPAAGRPLSMVLQGRRPRSPPAGPAALPVAGFSCFLPIRDTSGYKPRSFRSSLRFYGQRQVELLRGT